MIVRELKGYKSYRAFNVFQSLMLGLKMLPDYAGIGMDSFFDYISSLEPSSQERLIREAVRIVPIEKDELETLVCFCSDANGVPYEASNIGNLGPAELVEVIVAVCKEIAKIKITLVSETEKKN